MKDKNAKRLILIVDDDELNSIAFAKRLEHKGFCTKVTTNSHTALEFIKKEHVDLVLLDIVMPDIDGISLLKEIRTKYSSEDLPVIMVTAIDDSSDIFDAFEAGANDYITKPVNIDAATSRIRGQLNAIELAIERTKKKELDAVNAMVVTYHHEINNPLAIAKSELQLLCQDVPDLDQESLNRIYTAFDRIETLLSKIKDIAEENKISFDLYANKSKMLKIKNQ